MSTVKFSYNVLKDVHEQLRSDLGVVHAKFRFYGERLMGCTVDAMTEELAYHYQYDIEHSAALRYLLVIGSLNKTDNVVAYHDFLGVLKRVCPSMPPAKKPDSHVESSVASAEVYRRMLEKGSELSYSQYIPAVRSFDGGLTINQLMALYTLAARKMGIFRVTEKTKIPVTVLMDVTRNELTITRQNAGDSRETRNAMMVSHFARANAFGEGSIRSGFNSARQPAGITNAFSPRSARIPLGGTPTKGSELRAHVAHELQSDPYSHAFLGGLYSVTPNIPSTHYRKLNQMPAESSQYNQKVIRETSPRRAPKMTQQTHNCSVESNAVAVEQNVAS